VLRIVNLASGENWRAAAKNEIALLSPEDVSSAISESYELTEVSS